MKIRLTHNSNLTYHDKTYGPGDVLSVPDELAKQLIQGGTAEEASKDDDEKSS